MATEKWTAATSRGTVLTTQLNALAGAAYSAVGTAVANQTNKDRLASAVLNVTYASAPNDDEALTLYAVPAWDGTNYADGGSTVRPDPQAAIATFLVRGVTTAQVITCPPFELPPTPVKFVLYNGTSADLPATGTTVTLYTFNREIA